MWIFSTLRKPSESRSGESPRMTGFTVATLKTSSAIRAIGKNKRRFSEKKNARRATLAENESTICSRSGKKLGFCKLAVQKRIAIAEEKPATAIKPPRFVNNGTRYRSRKRHAKETLASPSPTRVLSSVEKLKSVWRTSQLGNGTTQK